jgi:hypothetical protein
MKQGQKLATAELDNKKKFVSVKEYAEVGNLKNGHILWKRIEADRICQLTRRQLRNGGVPGRAPTRNKTT